jgi:glycolate oxidase iron-sulfur subunit
VAYFTGCATHHIFEQTGYAALKVLRRMGYRILLPPGQGCCGLPLLFHGSIAAARDTVRANLGALRSVACDAVLVDCATCGAALGHVYPRVAAELGLPADDARAIAAKVWDMGAFVQERFDDLAPHLAPGGPQETVISHLPCHLKNHGKGADRVDALLQALPHVAYRRMADQEACCGGGGLFSNEFPAISKQMVDAKIASALASGAQFWATGCPGCRVQLAGNLPRKGLIAVCHPLEVVARGLP